MKIGMDLDGTLDRPHVRDLALALLTAGHEVHIISGTFPEGIGWQDSAAKYAKLARLDIPYTEGPGPPREKHAHLHIIDAVPSTYDRDYRLADIGLRKGALCESLGIQLFFEDSERYCEMIPKMAGDTVVLQVRPS